VPVTAQYRLWRAEKLIYRPKETAALLGYGDALTFSAQFKVLTDMPLCVYQRSMGC